LLKDISSGAILDCSDSIIVLEKEDTIAKLLATQ